MAYQHRASCLSAWVSHRGLGQNAGFIAIYIRILNVVVCNTEFDDSADVRNCFGPIATNSSKLDFRSYNSGFGICCNTDMIGALHE